MTNKTVSPAGRFEPSLVEAVVFDIGGVFLYPHHREIEALQHRLGLEPDPDLDAYRRAHHAGCLALSSHFESSSDKVDEHRGDFWERYDRAYATSLGVPEQQLDACRVAIRVSWDWPHQENIDAFGRLAGSGMPVAIVSNNDGSAPQQMIDFGVCQVGEGPLPAVAAVVDSGSLGIAKPDPAIMSPALDALGKDPDRVLYVGDTVHADIVGATNAGMQCVQLDPFGHHTAFSHARVPDVASVVELLNLS